MKLIKESCERWMVRSPKTYYGEGQSTRIKYSENYFCNLEKINKKQSNQKYDKRYRIIGTVTFAISTFKTSDRGSRLAR